MNPYETSPALMREQQLPPRCCLRCGGEQVERIDTRFPPCGTMRLIVIGWAIRVLCYAFMTPVDRCGDCGARVHVRSTGSLLTMIAVIMLGWFLIQAGMKFAFSR